MTKREYLESIGYTRRLSSDTLTYEYEKSFDNGIMIIDIQFDDFMIELDCIWTQEQIDNLQIAFNNVRRDYEEMQKYKEE